MALKAGSLTVEACSLTRVTDDGKITLPEYAVMVNQTFAEVEEAVRIYPRIAALFMRADADSDGNLTRTEMRSLLSGADQDSK